MVEAASPLLRCPECGSERLYRDGLRYLSSGETVQRWLCRNCGYRFTERHNNSNINTCRNGNRQVCAILEEAKNLSNAQETRTCAGEKETQQQQVKGKIVELCFKMRRDGYSEETIRLTYSALKVLIVRGADLYNPDSVKDVIARQKWSEVRKRNVINAYTKFLKFLGLSWEPPKCRETRKIPFIPTEQEIDDLIAGSPVVVAAFLQLLKETAMRCGEALRLKWRDVDFERRIITLNEPEKGSLPRIFSNLSGKLLSMLNNLPRKNEFVFGDTTRDSIKNLYLRAKKRLAFKLGNPRLNEIHFHTLRHWKATMEYHRTKDILHVKEFLGHKEIDNTLVYIQIDKALFQNVPNDQFITRVAHNTEEACKLIEAGFEYVTGEYNDGGKIFRKRK